jgi:hypothetical protein
MVTINFYETDLGSKNFFTVVALQAAVLVNINHFYPGQIFLGKASTLPDSTQVEIQILD